MRAPVSTHRPVGRTVWTLASLLCLAVLACNGSASPTDAGTPDVANDRLVAPDAPVATDGGDAAIVAPDGDKLGDRLLCGAMCARQERPLCALFDRDRCETECLAEVSAQSARCRAAVELALRCRASGAFYVCDDRGLPATSECRLERAALAVCLGVPFDAGDAGDASDVAPDLSVAPDVTDVGGDAEEVTDAGGVTDADDDAGDVAHADDVTDADDVADIGRDLGPEDAPPSGCAAPQGTITVPGPAVLREGTTLGRGTNAATTCRPDTDGPEHAYTFTVTARTGVVIDTEGASTTADTVIALRRTCSDVRTELLCDDDSGRSNTALVRAVVDVGTYSLLVEGGGGSSGTYALRVRSYTPAANATCAGAAALAPGATLSAQNSANGGLRGDHCRVGTTGGPLFYSVAVPPTSRVEVRVTPTGPSAWAPLVGAVTTCGARPCATQSAGETPGAPSVITLLNTGTTARTFYVSVANGVASDGTFDISASMAMSTAPGTTCASAVVLTAGATAMTRNLVGAFQSGADLCLSGITGPQTYYVLRLAARQRGVVTVTPRSTPAWAPVVRVLASCVSRTCTGSAQAPAGAPATAVFDNSETVPIDVVFAVVNASSSGGVFDIAARVEAVPPGVTCAVPVALTPGTVWTGNTLNGSVSGASLCVPEATGPQYFFSLRVPAGQRGTLRATPSGASAWRPTVRALTSCSSAVCSQSATAPATGSPIALSIDNPSTAPVDLVFSVAGGGVPPGGALEALATLSPADPAPYVLTVIPVACDAIGPTTLVTPADGWDDDVASDIAPLPFSVSFFGSAATHYSVSSNGFVQLWPAGAGEPSLSERNEAMPNNLAPNGLVAPFWDDLAPFDDTTDVRVATLGAAPRRRFVVQWTNWQVLGDTSSRLVFQARLFEGTHVIEMHYCTLTPARALPFGSSATVGVESFDGRRGVTVAHERFNALDPANAFRLTPR